MPAPRPGPLAYARDALRQFTDSIHRAGPDFVYVPSADGLSQMIGVARATGRRVLPRGTHAEALMLRGSFAYPSAGWRGRLKERLSWAAATAAPWSLLHHLDPLVYERAVARRPALAARMRVMPDPVEPPTGADRREVLTRLGVPADGGRYIGTAGLLDARKGVDLLIRAYADARRAGRLRADDRLLLVGRHDPAIAALLAGDYRDLVRSGHVQSVDRVVGAEEFVDAIGAMDVVATPYPRHIGSASIVLRAAAAGRPVLGGTFGWIGWAVSRFGLGRTVDVADPAAFADALVLSLEESPEYHPPAAARRFVDFHTPDNYHAHWTSGLRQRLGLPQAANLVTWESVARLAVP
jgi:glycosyltransferase involved in cell wall biosynthesis